MNDEAGDFGVTLARSGELAGFRLSTQKLLWHVLPAAPCNSLAISGRYLYAACGDRVLSYEESTGRERVVDRGAVALELLPIGSKLIVRHGDGRVLALDSASTQVPTTVIPFLRGLGGSLLVGPIPETVCSLGPVRTPSVPNGWAYTAGCYRMDLSELWSKRITMTPPAKNGYDLRQLGPFRAVFQDQPPIWEGNRLAGPSRGTILQWRDGSLSQFEDGTFATIEGSKGERLTTPDVVSVFERTKRLQVEHELFAAPDALQARDGERVFILIRNGSSGLAGIDLSSGHVLFLVPVPSGAARTTLEIVSGRPIVRTVIQSRWRATVHDPRDGRVLYEDMR